MAQKSFVDILYDASQALEKQRKSFEETTERSKTSYESSFKMTSGYDDLKATFDEDGLSFDVNWRFKIKEKSQLDTLLLYLMTVRESMD